MTVFKFLVVMESTIISRLYIYINKGILTLYLKKIMRINQVSYIVLE